MFLFLSDFFFNLPFLSSSYPLTFPDCAEEYFKDSLLWNHDVAKQSFCGNDNNHWANKQKIKINKLITLWSSYPRSLKRTTTSYLHSDNSTQYKQCGRVCHESATKPLTENEQAEIMTHRFTYRVFLYAFSLMSVAVQSNKHFEDFEDFVLLLYSYMCEGMSKNDNLLILGV